MLHTYLKRRWPLEDAAVDGRGTSLFRPSERRFLITDSTHAGINNLPKDLSERIATRLHEGGADLLSA